MIKAQFLTDQHFLGFGIIKKIESVVSGNPHPPNRQNDVMKDQIDL